MKKTKWVCTDIDTNQYGRIRLDLDALGLIFEFKQKNAEKIIIDLREYTAEEMQANISPFCYSLNPASSLFIFDIYSTKKEVLWIIAECIYENLT